MVYHERKVWATLIATVVATTAYLVVVLTQFDDGRVDAVEWAPVMLVATGGAIFGAIVLGIVWSAVAEPRDAPPRSDPTARDRRISRRGDHAAHSVLVAGGIATLVLCASQTEWFWIATTVFLAFALSIVAASIVRIVAYRRTAATPQAADAGAQAAAVRE